MASAAPLTMQAILVKEFGSPEVLQLEKDVSVPEVSGSQVLVKIASVGVNPVETYIRAGMFQTLPSLPYIPGTDSAGTVAAIGPNVQTLQVGDRVFTCALFCQGSGTYAQYATFDESSVFTLPSNLSFQQGAAIAIPYYTAYRALMQKGKVKAGDRVLVHGASGGVGIATVQIAHAYGCEVYGTASTPEGLNLVKESGARHVFNHLHENYIEDIQEATGNQGVDVIVEMLANKNLAADLELLSPKGRVLIVGSRGSLVLSPRMFMMKESSAMGVALNAATKEERHEMVAGIKAGMETGWVKPVIDKEYPLEKASQAHHDIIKSTGAKGKIVLSIPQ